MGRTSKALSLLSGSSTRGEPSWLGRLLSPAADAVDEKWRTLIGAEIEDRLTRVALTHGGADPFGLDLQWGKYALTFAAFLHRRYFRCKVSGIERVPPGRVLLIANHSGQVPIDGAMIGAALFFDTEQPRIVRSMVEKWSQTLPFVSVLFPRVGQVVGVPENARRLLQNDEAVLVFPEGSRGISKPFSQRYRMTEFGLGFMRLALETNTPIVPVAVVGAEEQYINVANLSSVAKLLNAPVVPLVPQWLIPGLQLPLPTRYHLHFGDPIRFDGDPDDDDAVIEEKVATVKATIQTMLARGLKERRSVFFLPACGEPDDEAQRPRLSSLGRPPRSRPHLGRPSREPLAGGRREATLRRREGERRGLGAHRRRPLGALRRPAALAPRALVALAPRGGPGRALCPDHGPLRPPGQAPDAPPAP